MKTIVLKLTAICGIFLLMQACTREESASSEVKKQELKELLDTYDVSSDQVDELSEAGLDSIDLRSVEQRLKEWQEMKRSLEKKNLPAEDHQKLMQMREEFDNAASPEERRQVREKYAGFLERLRKESVAE